MVFYKAVSQVFHRVFHKVFYKRYSVVSSFSEGSL